MSMKNGKRSRRKTDDDLTVSPEIKSVKNKEQQVEAEAEVVVETKESENGVKETKETVESIESNLAPIQEELPESSNGENLPTNNDPEKPDEIVAEIDNLENKINEKIIDVVTTTETNGIDKDDTTDETEMEPLIVDAEEADPELQFDENSDPDSRKSSPVLSRCRTRRSQTRNIPTPKTPRAEINGDEDVSTATPDILETVELNESNDSATSTRVNIGSDATREIDLTVPDDKESFLNTAKELSVVETLRRISSRKTIRSTIPDYRRNLLKSNAERQDLASRSSIEKVAGQKRKSRSETPDGLKRFKMEPSSPGFFSYITSPINSIKNRFGGGEVSASTPKLTGYNKRQDILSDADFSKIEMEADQPAEKKWCAIM